MLLAAQRTVHAKLFIFRKNILVYTCVFFLRASNVAPSASLAMEIEF